MVAFGSQVTLGLSSNALDGDHRGSFLCTPELPAAASDAPAAAPGHRLVAVDRGPLCRQAHWTVELADRDIASAEASVTTSPQLRPNSVGPHVLSCFFSFLLSPLLSAVASLVLPSSLLPWQGEWLSA